MLIAVTVRNRFPMDIVFRIYDNCLASGIEAMFAFSMALLSKNETTLLSMKFDQLIQFLNLRVFDIYQVRLVGPYAPSMIRRSASAIDRSCGARSGADGREIPCRRVHTGRYFTQGYPIHARQLRARVRGPRPC